MKKTVTLSGAILLILGCSSTHPSFDASNTKVKVIEGKTFNIPEGATPLDHLAKQNEINYYKKSGVSDCKIGDVLWDAEDAKEQIAKAIKNGDTTIHQTLAKKGLIGCAHPIK